MEESEIWSNFKQGSEKDFTFLYRKYAPVLFKYGCKLSPDRDLVKDCLQLVFFHVWQNREHLSTPVSVKNYLLKALRHEIIKKTHPKEILQDLPDDYHAEVALSYESELISFQSEENTKSKIARLMAQLPARQREVIFLKYYNNLSYEEIAGIMGIEQDSVYKLTYKALEKLQKLFAVVVLFLSVLPFR